MLLEAESACGFVCIELSQCLRALHRRTLRQAALRRQQGIHPSPKAAQNTAHVPSHHHHRRTNLCPEDVEVHSFEVWALLKDFADIKLLPLPSCGDGADTSSHPAESARTATAPDVSAETFSSLGASCDVGKASARYKNMCLVAGEIGVSVGRVYTSLTAFTDADSAGTVQLAATRLLLRKAGKPRNVFSFVHSIQQ